MAEKSREFVTPVQKSTRPRRQKRFGKKRRSYLMATLRPEGVRLQVFETDKLDG